MTGSFSLRSAALLPVITILSATLLQGGTTLRWKLEEGQEIKHTSEMKTNSSTKMGTMDMKANQLMTMENAWKVGKISSEGKAEIVQSTSRIQMRIEQAMQGVMEYDSKAGKKIEGAAGEMLNPLLDAMTKGKTNFLMSSQGKVENVRLDEEFKKALQANPMVAQMGGSFSEDGMKQMLETSLPILPEGEIDAGKTWESDASVPLPFGTLSVHNVFTYKGPATKDGRSLEKILVTSDLKLKKKEGTPLQVEFKKMEASGEAWFDNKAGRFVEVLQKQKMVMEIQGPGGTPMESVTETTSTVKFGK